MLFGRQLPLAVDTLGIAAAMLLLLVTFEGAMLARVAPAIMFFWILSIPYYLGAMAELDSLGRLAVLSSATIPRSRGGAGARCGDPRRARLYGDDSAFGCALRRGTAPNRRGACRRRAADATLTQRSAPLLFSRHRFSQGDTSAAHPATLNMKSSF